MEQSKFRGNNLKRQGFTLIELLVVLAILSTLAAIIFPVFNLARESSRKTVCINTAHQAALGTTMYANDYDGAYPSFQTDPAYQRQPQNYALWHDTFCQGTSLQPKQPNWVALIQPYMKLPTKALPFGDTMVKTPVLYCPSDNLKRSTVNFAPKITSISLPPITSYEFKMWLAENRQEEEVISPTQMALFWEQRDFHHGGNYSEYDRRAALNVAFVDGHTRWLRLSETTSAKFGSGPDLHWVFVPTGENSSAFEGMDVMR